MLVMLALVGTLLVGLALGLLWRGLVIVGDRRALERLAADFTAEQRMAAMTHATLAAMRAAARQERP